MNKHKIMFTTLSLVLMLISPLLCFALPESGETVTKRGTVDDDYYAAGGIVDVDAVISGDSVIAGGELFIGHQILGDVIVAGGSVHIRGDIKDDVRAAGGEIMIDADIGDDLIASGGRIDVSADTTVGGEVWLAGGDVHVAGTVNGDLVIAAGSVLLSGTVHGDVRIEGGKIQILEGVVIDGDLYYKSPQEADIHSAARITGQVVYEQVELGYPHRGFGIFFVITMVVTSIVLFKLFPGFTLSAVGMISVDPLKSLGAGLLALIILPIVAILLISIVLGVWVGLSIFSLYFVALLLKQNILLQQLIEIVQLFQVVVIFL